MTGTEHTGWIPPSVIDDMEALLADPAPHTIVLGRVGDDQACVAEAVAERRGSGEVIVLHDECGADMLPLEDDGPGLVLVTTAGVDAIPADVRSASSLLRLRPWSEHDVAAYFEHRTGRPAPTDLVRALIDATGGHAVFVRHFVTMRQGPLADEPILSTALWEQAIDRQTATLGAAARTLLEELSLGFCLQGAPLAPTLVGSDHRDRLVEQLDRHALLGRDGELLPLARSAVRHGLQLHRVISLGHAVIEGAHHPAPHSEVIAELVEGGSRCQRLVDLTLELGDADLIASPQSALQWYDRAEHAGASPAELAARRAEALVRTGDVAAAAHTADLVLASGDARDLHRVVSAALVAHVERGLASHARELAMWADTALETMDAVDVTAVRASAGDPLLRDGSGATAGATAPVPPGVGRAPTLGGVASRTAREGLRDSLTEFTTDAVAELVKSARLQPPDRAGIAPFPIALVAGWAALHAGDPATARAVVGPPSPVRPHAVQRELLLGWAALWQGQVTAAVAHVDRATAEVHESQLRNRLLLASLRAGIARRRADEAGTVSAWEDATQCLGRVEPDLFSLLALGELRITAVRMRQSELIAGDLARAHRLLEDLGSPPLWSTPLNWAGVQAAILANRPRDIAPHAAALLHAATEHPFAAALAAAGKAWMHVLARDVDPPAIHAAANGLAAVSQAWDGARLAAHAAARCDNTKEATALRDLARTLRGPDATVSAPSQQEGVPGSILLSEREVEVARLVLEGKTYREVGAALYLSPRTVEHHMARIRRRSGATSRSELLERLQLTMRQLAS